MKIIFNYICGYEYPTHSRIPTHGYKLSHLFGSLKLFFKYLSKVVKYLFPSFISASSILFLILLIDVVLLEFVVYRVGLFSGRYFKVLSERDLAAFWSLAATSIAYIIINALMKSIKDFVTNLLGIVWRKYITLELHKNYFQSKNFYYLLHKCDLNDDGINNGLVNSSKTKNRHSSQVQNSIEPILGEIDDLEQNIGSNKNKSLLDNPDQRITQDVKSLCTSIANIVPLMLISPFVIGWYGYQVFKMNLHN